MVFKNKDNIIIPEFEEGNYTLEQTSISNFFKVNEFEVVNTSIKVSNPVYIEQENDLETQNEKRLSLEFSIENNNNTNSDNTNLRSIAKGTNKIKPELDVLDENDIIILKKTNSHEVITFTFGK